MGFKLETKIIIIILLIVAGLFSYQVIKINDQKTKLEVIEKESMEKLTANKIVEELQRAKAMDERVKEEKIMKEVIEQASKKYESSDIGKRVEW